MTAKRKKPDPLLDIRLPPSPASQDELYNYQMRVAFLLADAESRRGGLESKRAAEQATDALIKHYREAECRGRMQDLDIRVRFFREDLMARNGGKLPAPKGGRPAEEHEYFLIAFWIDKRIGDLGSARGNVEKALWGAVDRFCLGYTAIRNIFYSTRADKEWQREAEWRRSARS